MKSGKDDDIVQRLHQQATTAQQQERSRKMAGLRELRDRRLQVLAEIRQQVSLLRERVGDERWLVPVVRRSVRSRGLFRAKVVEREPSAGWLLASSGPTTLESSMEYTKGAYSKLYLLLDGQLQRTLETPREPSSGPGLPFVFREVDEVSDEAFLWLDRDIRVQITERITGLFEGAHIPPPSLEALQGWTPSSDDHILWHDVVKEIARKSGAGW